MQVGTSPIQVGENPCLGGAIIELGSIPITETGDVVYFRAILERLSRIEHALDYLVAQTHLTRWERIKRWLGIR